VSGESRRFTDQEVALVLRRASEIDDTEAAGPGSGLSLDDLRDIAREVGISPAAIDRAVAGLDRGRTLPPVLAGAPAVRKAAHAVPGELDREAIARLVRIVDERTDSAGTVSEALGSVRWTGSDRFRSTRVSITPARGETAIEVVEKAEPRMRRIFHLLPVAWGVMLAGPLAASLQPGTAGVFAIAGVGAIAGLGAGRAVWTALSTASARRVRRLAELLADEAASTGG
jgi:hypothetical protein